jgi:hypothetical protein
MRMKLDGRRRGALEATLCPPRRRLHHQTQSSHHALMGITVATNQAEKKKLPVSLRF